MHARAVLGVGKGVLFRGVLSSGVFRITMYSVGYMYRH